MSDLDKLELVHCVIQEVIHQDFLPDLEEELYDALKLIEDLREPYLQEAA